jgi:hypothetical protein
VRRLYLLLGALAILVFLAISVLLARAWNAEGNERSAITDLLRDEAGGRGGAAVAAIRDCGTTPACRGRISALSLRLQRPGRVQILQLQPSTGFSLTGSLGVARVAWNTTQRPHPVVQCVQVRRSGNVLTGLHVQLLVLSAPIKNDAECPHRL